MFISCPFGKSCDCDYLSRSVCPSRNLLTRNGAPSGAQMSWIPRMFGWFSRFLFETPQSIGVISQRPGSTLIATSRPSRAGLCLCGVRAGAYDNPPYSGSPSPALTYEGYTSGATEIAALDPASTLLSAEH